MQRIGFHASHELYSPSELLHWAQVAERAGFSRAMCSDHFAPWGTAQRHSGNAWSWLGAALTRTSMSFGTVCAPGQRYHPAIIAQAAATLCEMFPNRFWFAAGTGQNLNEHITGDGWPLKDVRRQRVLDSVELMRRLWTGEIVSIDKTVRAIDAQIFSLPATPPPIFGAALTEETAEWVGEWADGLLTVASDHQSLNKLIKAFRRGGGKSKPVVLQAAIAVGETLQKTRERAFRNWGVATLTLQENQDLATPQEFDIAIARHCAAETQSKLRISTDIQTQIDWLKGDFDLGVDTVYIHNVGGNMEAFLEVMGAEVLPRFE